MSLVNERITRLPTRGLGPFHDTALAGRPGRITMSRSEVGVRREDSTPPERKAARASGKNCSTNFAATIAGSSTSCCCSSGTTLSFEHRRFFLISLVHSWDNGSLFTIEARSLIGTVRVVSLMHGIDNRLRKRQSGPWYHRQHLALKFCPLPRDVFAVPAAEPRVKLDSPQVRLH